MQALVYLRLSQKKEQAENVTHMVHLLELNILEQAKSINDFFTYETSREDFFITSSSPYIDQRKTLNIKFRELTQKLLKNHRFKTIDERNGLARLLSMSDSLNKDIDTITKLIYRRGFKDYSLEGQMRHYAHKLEKSECFALADILMLRRHEKDYIIRNEEKYIFRFNNLCNELISITNSASCKKELRNYQLLFNEVVAIDRMIGIKDNSALRLKIDHTLSSMLSEAMLLNNQCREYRESIYRNIKRASLTMFVFITILGLIVSYFLSRLITRRITQLTESITDFVKSGFTQCTRIETTNNNDEISLLIRNFEIMRSEICNQLNYLEKAVAERTEEILAQKELMVKQNKKMRDSIKYAQYIQESILPSGDYISETLPEHFIFFKPKDFVSGDFYYYKHIQNNEFDVTILAVADCTGHGVPGGLMSMLGISTLEEIIFRKDVRNAADVLNRLREKITGTLSTEINGRLIRDGMDIALVVIDHRNQQLQFAGAHRPLYLIRNGELMKIKGDSMPIGWYCSNRNFTLHTIDLENNDILYLFTDGFVDQYNKGQSQKYLEKYFRTLIKKISSYPLAKQKQMLETEFLEWKEDNEQTDDVLIMGVKIKLQQTSEPVPGTEKSGLIEQDLPHR